MKIKNNPASLKEIKKIANKIRKIFEEIEHDENGMYGYPQNGLGGYCGRASVQLYLACKRAEIKMEIWESKGHSFNVVDKKIIDITATQFGHKQKVFMCSLKDCENKSREEEYINIKKSKRSWAYENEPELFLSDLSRCLTPQNHSKQST